ncbi:MAG: 2-isopropylmalate synthase [Pseudomonadota bacterium]
MPVMPVHKYRPFAPIGLTDRCWPDATITKPPIWCSVDLRDGNQALIQPMGMQRKLRMFNTLAAIGYKEIEVGFPAASQTDFDFVRKLIDDQLIPDDVTIQVLTQARDHLIKRTFEALAGVRSAIVHFYNSTSTVQRRVVFDLDREGICDIAVRGARTVCELAAKMDTSCIQFQYSPESFTQTELEFTCEICTRVMEILLPASDLPLIINLPATVEAAGPHIYADQIEWMDRNLPNRQQLTLSLHPHNDRGSAVAAAELGLMAGAQRIEGTLFGNGERTGNVDLVTLGMNMVSQGVDAGIDFSDLQSLVEVAQYCNQLPVGERHPYAGKLVFTAFSGSHQDAINKGMKAMEASNSKRWEVPYLPIDPSDVGASYEAVIRINSQSGKGGVAWVMEQDFGLRLPKRLQIEFSSLIQNLADDSGAEIDSDTIWQKFLREYIEPARPYELKLHQSLPDPDQGEQRITRATILHHGKALTIEGKGTGPIDSFVDAMRNVTGLNLQVVDYIEHALGYGADTRAAAYIEMADAKGRAMFGVGIDANITTASLKAVLSVWNRFEKNEGAGT